MKSYTDIEQSKKLAEILPIESADAWWAERYGGKVTHGGQYIVNEEPIYYISFIKPSEINYSQDTVKDIPCWSLAALLEVMPKQLGRYTLTFYWCDDSWCCSYIDDGSEIKETSSANNPVDAAVEMIVKLKEKDLL